MIVSCHIYVRGDTKSTQYLVELVRCRRKLASARKREHREVESGERKVKLSAVARQTKKGILWCQSVVGPKGSHTPKAVTYHEPTVRWLFMIGHSLDYAFAWLPPLWHASCTHNRC